MDRTAARFALWVLVGTLLLQAAWVLALPPFRGIDEFDHAYRAAAVADGQWLPSGRTDPESRGELVWVPATLVADAAPVCQLLRYTGRYNCAPRRTSEDGLSAEVATVASTYPPVFYGVIGTTAQPFDGAAALLAMRLTNVLLCSVVVAAAAWVTARWSTTVWPRVALLATCTPVVLYAGAVAAPNALEALVALGLWTSLIGLKHAGPALRPRLLLWAAAFAVPLANLRALGPVWTVLVILAAAVWVGPACWRALAAHRTALLSAGLVVATALGAGTAWLALVGSVNLDENPGTGSALVATALSVPLWLLQALAAFPLRNEPAPMVVYATGLLALAGLLGLGLAQSGWQRRALLLVGVAVAVAVPFVLQVRVFEDAGLVWQGRYGWPFGLGVLVLAGAALEERPPRHPLVLAAVPPGLLLWGVAHVSSVVGVHLGELRDSPLAGDPRWVTAPAWVVGAVAVLGVVSWGAGALRGAALRDRSEPGPHAPDLVLA